MLHSLKNNNRFRGPSSSEEFNQQVMDTREDMQVVYDTLNQNEKDIHENSNVLLSENFFLQRRVEALENEVRKLYALSEEESPTPLLYANFFSNEAINLHTENPVVLDREYGVAMPNPTSITNKLNHLTDSGKTVIPHDLEIIIEEEHAKEFRSAELQQKMVDAGLQATDIFSQTNVVSDDNFDHIVDKKRETYWTRQVIANGNLELFGRMVIRVPKEGVTNLFSNTLKISPYPEGSMTIQSIMVKGLGNQWDLLENYPVDDEGHPVPIKNAGKLLFQFPRKEITEIVINFSQPYYLENNNQKIFTYGFQGVDLEYRLFTEKANSFVTVIDVSSTGQLLTEIKTPEVVVAPGSTKDVEYLIEHKLFYDPSLETEFSFNTDILMPVDKAYVQTILKRDGDKVPVLHELQIAYNTDEV